MSSGGGVRRIGWLAKRLAGLSVAEWLDLLRAQGALLTAQVIVWTRPMGRLVVPDASGPAAEPKAPPVFPQPLRSPDDALAVRLADAVERAAMYGVFRPLCLVRALAIQRMLEARGIHGSQIRIGVGHSGGSFVAHAWVEYGDLVLGDNPWRVRRFAPLTDVRLVERQ